jgi:hypothetical protein
MSSNLGLLGYTTKLTNLIPRIWFLELHGKRLQQPGSGRTNKAYLNTLTQS